MSTDANKQLYIKLLFASLLILSSLAIHIVNPEFYPRIWYLATSGDLDTTIEFLRSFGVWAILVSILIDILINALGFLPSIFISTANGVLFGVFTGIIISWLAETIGVIISFLILRYFLRESAEKIIRQSNYLQKVDEFSGKNGFKVMLLARTLPYFPSGILTALGAVSSISVRHYILANLVGKFPSTALEVIIGHDLVTYQENMDRLALFIILITLVYGGVWYYNRRRS